LFCSHTKGTMRISEAVNFVDAEIARIEAGNKDKELRPWIRDAAPDAPEHWGRVQQRIALGHPQPHTAACCKGLNLEVERSEAQIAAAALAGARLSAARGAARPSAGGITLRTNAPVRARWPQSTLPSVSPWENVVSPTLFSR